MAPKKPKVPIASYASNYDAPAPVLKLKRTDWQKLEKILGGAISPELRRDLRKVTNCYLKLATGELAIEPLTDAVSRLTRLTNSASAFWKVLNEAGSSDANCYIDSLIEAHFKGPKIARRDQMRILTDIMTGFVGACEAAERDLDNETGAGHVVGDYWTLWIVQLTELLSKNELPTAVRKDLAKSRSGRVSHFVRFVCELQNQFDEELRRGRHGLTALTEAISKARGSHRPLKRPANKTRP